MDSAALLDLLGNENRRRILRLLAQRPCYVTEISDALGVSPKAVIGHLRKLDEAGLVESRVDDGRRKYFRISRNLRLEVTVSPYGFGAKSAYPASSSLDIASCRYVSIDVATDDTSDLADLAADLHRFEELEDELSLAQRWVQGRLATLHDALTEEVEAGLAVDDRPGTADHGDARFCAEVLAGIEAGARTADKLAERLGVPLPVVEDALDLLMTHGLASRENGRWTVE
ncbi:metalloregulator ArsR/SmtB family transcription factor [Halococcus sp. IIIV-5B]|uniref:ArsR/SmtB family transcription factor n=1 Tax=Halococcus sp. IIIV-5B TaxID=2321230 RepID=UPI000E7204D4|nr:metalloregulator ArsR/SmtB family transcription factor [Halococcus sp. IIIV-5B]RJT01172.1 ArsR family transcriptional regulator [Halococcus sp. IIIV-5B]